MNKQRIFEQAVRSSEPQSAPPSEDKLQMLEKDLTNDMKKAKADDQYQAQGGGGAGMTEKQKQLASVYSLEDNIDYNNKLGDFSFQIKQNPLDTMRNTDTMKLSTMQSRDSLNVGANFDQFSESMLYSQRKMPDEKQIKLGKKRSLLRHFDNF